MADVAVAERTLPHNLEAERSVLGSILLPGALALDSPHKRRGGRKPRKQ